MLYFWLAVLVMCYIAFHLGGSLRDATIDKYRYGFFSLRDRLRRLAIEGILDQSAPLFHYLDRSITSTIWILPKLSIYAVMLMSFGHKRDRKIGHARRQLERAVLNGPDELKQIYEEYTGLSMLFLKERSPLICRLWNLWHRRQKPCEVRGSELVASLPETSQILTFSH